MTQQQNPGQPYVPPSAPSGATGQYQAQQPYQPQSGASYQAAPAGQYAPAGQAPAPGAPMTPAGPKPDSLMTNLFDTGRGFARRYGRLTFIVALVAVASSWVLDIYNATSVSYISFDGATSVNAVSVFMTVLFKAPWYLTVLLLVRLFIELVAGTTPANGTGSQA